MRIETDADKRFYDRAAEILGVEHRYLPFPHHKRTRWNNRKPGSGRFPDRGLVRLFGGRVQVALHRPRPVHRWFDSREEALRFLEEISRPRAG